tara:strand:- start:13701 stop:14012 length:312 start_codon:yes stop_codon:yes gene_type:complete
MAKQNKFIALWKERKMIFEGLKNAVIYDEFVEGVAEGRNKICNQCKHKGDKCMVPKTGPCCNLCGCSLKLKTRSLSTSCPDKKWKALLTEEQEDELDEKFNED